MYKYLQYFMYFVALFEENFKYNYFTVKHFYNRDYYICIFKMYQFICVHIFKNVLIGKLKSICNLGVAHGNV